MMAGIRGKNTRPELLLRKELFRQGFRFRLHVKDLPGHPDLVFTRHKAVILVHGCFWHGHGCEIFVWPKSNAPFWRTKILRNRRVDRKAYRALRADGWRVMTVWECAFKGPGRIGLETVARGMTSWLRSTRAEASIRGRV
jgi:DNA mismatch endonuclease (patch repair protein)